MTAWAKITSKKLQDHIEKVFETHTTDLPGNEPKSCKKLLPKGWTAKWRIKMNENKLMPIDVTIKRIDNKPVHLTQQGIPLIKRLM